MPVTSVTPEGLAYTPLINDPQFGQLRPVFARIGEAIKWSFDKNQFVTPHPFEDALRGVTSAVSGDGGLAEAGIVVATAPVQEPGRRPILRLPKRDRTPV